MVTDDNIKLKAKKTQHKHRFLKRLVLTFVWFFAVMLLLPLLLYVPFVQNYAREMVEANVGEAMGCEVSIGKLGVSFPLRITVDDVLIKQKNDTMLCSRYAEVNLRILPLFSAEVAVDGITVGDACYNMVSADSSMILRARLKRFCIYDTRYNLFATRLSLDDGVLDDAFVSVDIDERKAVKEPQDSTDVFPLLVTLGKLHLKNVTYRMSMMPAIDSLDVKIKSGSIGGVSVNMANNVIKAAHIEINGLDARYYQPDAERADAFAAQIPVDTLPPLPTAPWTVIGERLRLYNSHAVYAISGVEPSPGFDPSHIEVNDLNIAIDNVYNRASIIRVPIVDITAHERCGLSVSSMSGLLSMDENILSVDNFNLTTDSSAIGIDAQLEMSALEGNDNARLSATITSKIGFADAERLMPVLSPVWESFGSDGVDMALSASGTAKSLEVKEITLGVPDVLTMTMKGLLHNILAGEKIGGKVNIDGKLTGGNKLKKAFDIDGDFSVPVVTLKGAVECFDNVVACRLRGSVAGGKIVADGRLNMNSEGYSADVDLQELDVRALLPQGDIGKVSATINATGQRFDIYKMKTDVAAVVECAEYSGVAYRNLIVEASLDNGDCRATVVSDCEMLRMNIALDGSIAPDKCKMKIDGIIDNFDLLAMNFSEERLNGAMDIHGMMNLDLSCEHYAGLLRLSNVFLALPENTFRTDSIDFGFRSDPERTGIRLRNNDMKLTFRSPVGVMALSDSLVGVMPAIDSMLVAQRVDMVKLNRHLPHFKATFTSKNKNIVHTYLAGMGTKFEALEVNLEKSDEMQLDVRLKKLDVNDVLFDDVLLSGYTQCDSLRYAINVANNPGNQELLKWAEIKGSISDNRADVFVTQIDHLDDVGFKFGVKAALADSIVTANVYPNVARIAFRDWGVNPGNFVAYDMGKSMFKADMMLSASETSFLNIYTDRDGNFHKGIHLDLDGILLKDWLVLSPFSPPIDGDLSGNIVLNYNDKYYWGIGSILVDRLAYGKNKIGDLGVELKLAMADEGSKLFARADMDLDKQRIMTLKGYKKDSLDMNELKLDLLVDRLPMKKMSAFLPENTGTVDGYLNGKMNIGGSVEAPTFNGYIQMDTASVSLPAFGTKLTFDSQPIPVDDGRVVFEDYDLYGVNGKPLSINGFVDLNLSPDKIFASLTMKGKEVQVVGGKKSGKAELYGKGFIDINSAVKGYLNDLDVKASLNVLAGTNLTYVYQSASMAISEGYNEEVVKFVNFSDTTTVAADTIEKHPYAMRIKAILMIEPNAVFNVLLSTDGKNKIQIDGEGTLSYSQNDQGDMSLIGTYNINKGFVRYSPPMMSEKNFKFEEGSHITWTGNILNPQLSMKAVQSMKVNIGGGNQGSRSVPFDVILNVGNTLNSLAVTFDLSTDADMTIANELSGMTAEQRSVQAMNMLLYNTYTGGSSVASNPAGELSGNMAFSFLESMVNKWAAGNISGVDLSFGIDQYDTMKDGTATKSTSYSYKVSKSVFDDRFTIVVGGNYVTDASAEDNLAQNLLNDIAFEYKLNKTGTTNVRLFYHKDYESILEGEITEYGAGFLWKRKITSFGDMFRFIRPKKTEIKNENK